jgi:hypothetical protein
VESTTKRRWRVAGPSSRFGLIYGTITVGAILGAENAGRDGYRETIEGLIVAILLFWLAHAYAAYTAHRMERTEPLSFRAFGHAMLGEATVILGAVVPVLVLLAEWLFGVPVTTGVTVGVWTSAAVIAGIEIWIGIRGHLKPYELLVQSVVGVVLALLVIALNSIIH